MQAVVVPLMLQALRLVFKVRETHHFDSNEAYAKQHAC